MIFFENKEKNELEMIFEAKVDIGKPQTNVKKI
jgi:hypothetical protein